MQTRFCTSRDNSPCSEISVGSPSPPLTSGHGKNNENESMYYQPMKKIKLSEVEEMSEVKDLSDTSHSNSVYTSSRKFRNKIKAGGAKGFSISDILGSESDKKNQQQGRIVRPWDHLQHPITIRPLLPPALLQYEQILAMDYHQQLQDHFRVQSQLLRQMNLDIVPSESGSDRSSSASDFCLPEIGRSSENSESLQTHTHKEKSVLKKQNKSPNGTPLDALFQLSNKNFDDQSDVDNSNLDIFATRQNPKKKRKSRTAFTNHQIFELEKRFLYQKYLSPVDRDEIAASLGLTNAQVITWFQNRRAKMKRDMEEIKKDVESVKTLSSQKSFLENITDMNILKSKSFHIHNEPKFKKN